MEKFIVGKVMRYMRISTWMRGGEIGESNKM